MYFLEDVTVDCSNVETLHFVHTTNSLYAQQIIEMDQLRKFHCKVFNEELVYLFYGKPAYTPKREMPSADYAELPVVLVFRNIIPLHRIFPFDTGAFQKELYIEEIDDKYKLTEFAMNPEIDEIKKLIVAFFENNDQYWEGIATGNKNHVDGNYHREALYRLFTSTRAATYDERCYTIEIQADTHIDLNRYLCAVVASHNFLNRKDSNGMLYSDRFKAMNIHYEPYDGIGRFTPKKFQLKLNELVKKYYCSVGLMR